MSGAQLILTYTIDGYRDCLDEREIHAGDGIDLWDDGVWVPGRYEYHGHTAEAWFIYDHEGEERVLDIERDTMRFSLAYMELAPGTLTA